LSGTLELALDYSKRIGITGLSGGRIQSTLIAAFDERIYGTAPSCFVTSMRRLFESDGIQEAEQNLRQVLKICIFGGIMT
jgi:hypothetical protein